MIGVGSGIKIIEHEVTC